MDEPQPGRDDILAIARLAGLHLPAAYESELVEAYELGGCRRGRPRADEPWHRHGRVHP
jgi:hypothetical protein